MHKKILGICAALVALGALAIGPATAMAETHFTDTTEGVNTTVGAGAKLKAIGTVAVFKAGESLTVTCNENFLTGAVHRDEAGTVEASITNAQFDSNLTESPTDCSSSLGATRVTIPALEGGGTWCLKNGVGDNGSVFGRACTAESVGVITFILDVTGVTSCKYKREAAIAGTFSTPENHSASVLTVAGGQKFVLDEPNIFCPKEGEITEMSFGIYTDTAEGTNNWDDAASTADPVWLEA